MSALSGDGLWVAGNLTYMDEGCGPAGNGYSWTLAAGFTLLPPCGGRVNDLDLDGAVAVGAAGAQAGTWRSGELEVLSDLLSEAQAVNADGSVIVGNSSDDGLIWTGKAGLRRLVDVLTEQGLDLEGGQRPGGDRSVR